MAMKPCKECGQEVSTKATKCPGCGAPLKRKPIGCFGAILIVLLAVALITPFIGDRAAPGGSAATPAVPKTPEQLRDDQITGQFSAWDGSHLSLTRSVKQALNDPKSFEHIETTYGDRGEFILVRMKFRAKNAFGGYVVQVAEGRYSLEGQALAAPVLLD